VIRNADWILDLGPEGGEDGGRIIAEGRPAKIAATPGSFTGQFLKRYYSSADAFLQEEAEPAADAPQTPEAPSSPLPSAEKVEGQKAEPAAKKSKPAKPAHRKRQTTKKTTAKKTARRGKKTGKP
jgi:excinuclease ABC subunit A